MYIHNICRTVVSFPCTFGTFSVLFSIPLDFFIIKIFLFCSINCFWWYVRVGSVGWIVSLTDCLLLSHSFIHKDKLLWNSIFIETAKNPIGNLNHPCDRIKTWTLRSPIKKTKRKHTNSFHGWLDNWRSKHSLDLLNIQNGVFSWSRSPLRISQMHYGLGSSRHSFIQK